MVTIATDKSSAGESPERGALVLATLGYHKRLLEYHPIEAFPAHRTDLQPAIRGIQERLVHKDYVINVPYALICQRAVSSLEHRPERREEILLAYLLRLLLAVHEFDHTPVGRVVIHIPHHHYLYARIFFLHLQGVAVYYLCAPASQIPALATDTGWKMRHIDSELLPVQQAVHHQYVPGLELLLTFLIHRKLYEVAVEVERYRLAVDKGEIVRSVEKGHIHSAGIRSIIMHYLIVRGCNLGLAHQILKDETVLNLTHSQQCVETAVGLRHGTDDSRHIMELLLVFDIRPLVLAIRQEFLIVPDRIVISIEQVLQIVEPYDIVLLLPGIVPAEDGNPCNQEKRDRQENMFLHVR